MHLPLVLRRNPTFRRKSKLVASASRCSSSCNTAFTQSETQNVRIWHKNPKKWPYIINTHDFATKHFNKLLCEECDGCKSIPLKVVIKEIDVQGRLNDSCHPGYKQQSMRLGSVKNTYMNLIHTCTFNQRMQNESITTTKTSHMHPVLQAMNKEYMSLRTYPSTVVIFRKIPIDPIDEVKSSISSAKKRMSIVTKCQISTSITWNNCDSLLTKCKRQHF